MENTIAVLLLKSQNIVGIMVMVIKNAHWFGRQFRSTNGKM
jgi:hypothetical protein